MSRKEENSLENVREGVVYTGLHHRMVYTRHVDRDRQRELEETLLNVVIRKKHVVTPRKMYHMQHTDGQIY